MAGASSRGRTGALLHLKSRIMTPNGPSPAPPAPGRKHHEPGLEIQRDRMNMPERMVTA